MSKLDNPGYDREELNQRLLEHNAHLQRIKRANYKLVKETKGLVARELQSELDATNKDIETAKTMRESEWREELIATLEMSRGRIASLIEREISLLTP